jgi:hypothetical protein
VPPAKGDEAGTEEQAPSNPIYNLNLALLGITHIHMSRMNLRKRLLHPFYCMPSLWMKSRVWALLGNHRLSEGGCKS